MENTCKLIENVGSNILVSISWLINRFSIQSCNSWVGSASDREWQSTMRNSRNFPWKEKLKDSALAWRFGFLGLGRNLSVSRGEVVLKGLDGETSGIFWFDAISVFELLKYGGETRISPGCFILNECSRGRWRLGLGVKLFLSFELLPQGLRQDRLPELAPLGPRWRPGCDSCLLDASTQCNPRLWSCYPVRFRSFTDTKRVLSRDEIPDDLHDLLTKLTLL